MLPIWSLLTTCASAPATHLDWAELLVDTVDPADNTYNSDPVTVTWEGYDGATRSSNRSKCSSFVSKVMVQSYDADLVSWTGCDNPSAHTWYNTIDDEVGFTKITAISDVAAGDILAIEYNDAGCTAFTCAGFSTCTSSGHTAFVASAPVARTATSPTVSGTTQYEVVVVDVSQSYHGTDDTRYKAEADGTTDQGVGEGVMRLYADSTGAIVGYTWSVAKNSTYYPQATRSLVIGRYDHSYDGG